MTDLYTRQQHTDHTHKPFPQGVPRDLCQILLIEMTCSPVLLYGISHSIRIQFEIALWSDDCRKQAIHASSSSSSSLQSS